MPSSNIKCVLLDIGDVLIEVDLNLFLTELGLTSEKDINTIRLHSAHDLYERGKMSSEDFLLNVKNLLKLPHDIDKIRLAWNKVLSNEVPGVAEVLSLIPADVPVFALSNTNPDHIDWCLNRFRLFDNFKEVLTSYGLGYRKPEKGIYLEAMEHIKLKPSEILFVDNLIENVEMAKEVGMQSEVCYHSAPRLKEIFASYGVIKA